MKTAITCFAGANTSSGFVSGFEGVFAKSRKTFFIKGAPGTGKSSLMKRIRERQTSLGHAVSSFYCSSDPDSLDAIIDETISCAVLDATHPHTYDPPYPGATGAILSMGDYLNERALYSDAGKITRINNEMKAAFHAACSYLKSAKAVWEATAANEDLQKSDALSGEIVSAFPRANGLGSARTFFLEAFTHKGLVRFEGAFPAEITLSVPAPFPPAASLFLNQIALKARLRGLDAILFLSPIDPRITQHVFLPDVPLFVTSSPVKGAKKTLSDYASAPCLSSDDSEVLSSLTEQACRAMAKAKRLHDELENVYIHRMDFSRLIECESRIIQAFDEMKEL